MRPLLIAVARRAGDARRTERLSRRRNADWPVYGGNTDNTHYSTLSQITPANVARCRSRGRTRRTTSSTGSEMQANPIVIDGVLYATTPKLRVFALDAATGRELWSFDPNGGRPPPSRFRHRGVVVTGDRVLFTYRNRLWALDKKTGKPIPTFGDRRLRRPARRTRPAGRAASR